MALELIGAIALGFMAAGLALLALRLSRGRLPRALVRVGQRRDRLSGRREALRVVEVRQRDR